MLIIKKNDYEELSKLAAKFVINEISKNPNLTIALPTGKTPIGTYKLLIKAFKNKKVNFSGVGCFNLDEYYPIKKNNKNSYYYYLHKKFLNHVNIKKSNINLLNSEAKTPEKECRNFENKIKKNQIDLILLGVGINGHIAFNEPNSPTNSKARVIKLSSQTLKSNSKYFKNKKMPKYALTLGISTILSSKKIILLASGKNKAKAIKYLIEKPINKLYPVSFLKRHKNLIVIIDKQAASLLRK
jgi:glucosamine-6-phosphate deaminase